MKYHVGEVLKELEEDKINCKKAVKLIKKKEIKRIRRKKASKIKISVVNKSSNTSIKLPGIHFWFLRFLANIGISIANISIKRGKEIDEDLKMALDILDDIDIKVFIKELKKCGPFDLVHVQASEAYVRIRIL